MSLSVDAGGSRNVAATQLPQDWSQGQESQAAQPQTTAAPQPSAPEIHWNPQLARVISQALAANAPQGPAAGQGPSFDAQVRGQQPKPIDEQLAKLAQDVYELPDPNAAQPKNIDGWTRLDDSQLRAAGIDPASLEDPSTGFRAAIYQNEAGQKVLAFAGTDPTSGKDWLANGQQAAGLPAAQYDEAVALATKAKAAFGDDLVITGHSLGGGLASVASVATNSAAVTFNASGVNNETLKRYVPDGDPAALKQQAADGLVRRYAVDGDILTGEQEKGLARGLAPDAIGHKITLNDPNPPSWLLEAPGVNLVTDTVHGIANHQMDAVLSALAKDHPWAPAAGGKGVVDQIVDGTGKVGDAIVSGVDAVKNGAKDVVGGITGGIASLAGHVPLVGGLLEGAINGIGTVAKGGIEVAGDLVDGAVGVASHLVQGAEKFFGGAIGAAVDGVKAAGHAIVDGAKTVGGWIVDGAKAAGNAIVDGAKAAGNAVVDGAKTVGGWIVDGAKAAGNAIVDGAKAAGNAIVDGAKAAGNAIVDGAKATGNAIVDGAKAAGNAIVDGAKAAGNAVVDGAKAVGHAASKLLPWNW